MHMRKPSVLVIGAGMSGILMTIKLRQAGITDLIILEKSVSDPELRKKLTPGYQVGCKRMVLSSDFYNAVQQSNCELITSDIDHIEAQGIVTADGRHHSLDVLVLATGFKHFNFMRPMELIGRNGLSIDRVWEKQYLNYRSLTIPGFPNFFLMTGPNSPIGNYSVTRIAEVQADYLLKLISHWQQRQFDAVDPKPEAVAHFLERIQNSMDRTVWAGGCQSWYLDQSGTPVLWPWSFGQWVQEMRAPEMTDFELLSVSSDTQATAQPPTRETV